MQARKKLIYVEVRAYSDRMMRIVSKQNLNTVIETTLRKKNNNKMFDKFWYQTREEKFIKQPYDGLYVDQINMVAFGVIQSRLIEHENKMKKPA